MRQLLVITGFLLISTGLLAQQNSEHGWVLSPKDTIRVLFFLAEVDYDTLAHLAPSPDGEKIWLPGEFPEFANTVFDPEFHPEDILGTMTQYYHEASLGNLVVLGDYYPEVFTIPYSQILRGGFPKLFKEINAQMEEPLETKHGLGWDDFDLWMDNVGYGTEKQRRDTVFEGVDHIMLFIRNYHKMLAGNGMASGSSLGVVNGKKTNSYSVFGVKHKFPLNILKHELNHLFLGGNNFHCGGGNSSRFQSYFPSVQGGWSLMGAANSSYLTCAGWDRHRLGWKKTEKEFLINALNQNGEEVNGEVDRDSGGGVFILSDFVKEGHALRIELPYIPEEEYSQWVWLENHTTEKLNGSKFDVFQYEHFDCIEEALPGLAMYYQVDADIKEGDKVFSSVKADYLKPITAQGNFDLQWIDDYEKLEPCVNPLQYVPYYREARFENPLTGNHSQEMPFRYNDSTQTITKKNILQPQVLKRKDGSYKRIAFLGQQDDVFTLNGKNRLGVGTNPSSANALSIVNARNKTRENARNNRTIYINGLSIEILERFGDGSLKVEVRFDDNQIVEDRRWCAPSIVLGNHISEGPDLIVKAKLTLDVGETMTRFGDPVSINGKRYFTSPTELMVRQGAEMRVEEKLLLKGESVVKFASGSHLSMASGSKIELNLGTLIFIEGSTFGGKGRVKIKEGSKIICHDEATYKAFKKRTWNKRRVYLIQGNST